MPRKLPVVPGARNVRGDNPGFLFALPPAESGITEGMELPTKCRFRGEEMDLADARMMLTPEELREVEVTLPDGSVTNPFRESDPTVTIKDGIAWL